MVAAAGARLRLDASWVDYVLIAIYFAVVLAIGVAAKRSVSSSIDFFLGIITTPRNSIAGIAPIQ